MSVKTTVLQEKNHTGDELSSTITRKREKQTQASKKGGKKKKTWV